MFQRTLNFRQNSKTQLEISKTICSIIKTHLKLIHKNLSRQTRNFVPKGETEKEKLCVLFSEPINPHREITLFHSREYANKHREMIFLLLEEGRKPEEREGGKHCGREIMSKINELINNLMKLKSQQSVECWGRFSYLMLFE